MRNPQETLEFWNQSHMQNFDLHSFPPCSHCHIHLHLQNRFSCQHCHQIFCAEHLFTFQHQCPNTPKQPIPSSPPIIHPKCSFSKCYQKMDLCNRFTCHQCKQVFCMAHRHDFSHSCS